MIVFTSEWKQFELYGQIQLFSTLKWIYFKDNMDVWDTRIWS